MRAAVGGSVPAIRCLIAFGADVTLKDKAGATAERFAVKYGNTEARDVLKERARVLELVAWHRAAVREAAFWVQEAAAADAAVLLQRPFFVRVDGVAGDRSQSTAQAQHAMEAEAERARVEAYRLEQKAKAEEREERRKQKAAKDRQRKQEAEERRRKLKALS